MTTTESQSSAPSRADYQAAAEELGAAGHVQLAGWTIVKDVHAHYWRAFREAPCSITVCSASPQDLSVALATYDRGAGGWRASIPTGRGVAASVMEWVSQFEGVAELVVDEDLSELYEIAATALRATARPHVVEIERLRADTAAALRVRDAAERNAAEAFRLLRATLDRAEFAECERDVLRLALDVIGELASSQGNYPDGDGPALARCGEIAERALGVSDER